MFKRKHHGSEKCGRCCIEQGKQNHGRRCCRLSTYAPGDKGTVVKVCGNPEFRRRMMEMGFVKGAEVQVVKYAPLNDPIEFVLKGYHLSLRRREAAEILMDEPTKAAEVVA